MKKKLSNPDWKVIEEKLKSFFTPVKLNCDGYEITLVLRRITTFKNAIVVYINGEIKGEWFTNDCEERRRFFHCSTRSCLTKKDKEQYKKIFRSKKKMQELEERAKYCVYSPYWTSFGALKRHLVANNQAIEWINDTTEKEGEDSEYASLFEM